MWELLRRFRALPRPTRQIFLRAVILLPWVAVRLKATGFQATKNALLRRGNKSSAPENSTETRDDAAMAARMVRAAARHGFSSPSCLEESLVLVHMLLRRGIAAQLRIGVRRNQPKFEAHAWVECDGIALNESEALHDHYAPFEAEFTNLPAERP